MKHLDPKDKLRIAAVLLAATAFILAAFILGNTEHAKQQASANAQRAVSNHTETLAEIQHAVTQLEANNQTNHDTTITYIKCLAELIVKDSQGQTITQADLNDCNAVSGTAETTSPSPSPGPNSSSSPSSTTPTTTSSPQAAPAAQPSAGQSLGATLENIIHDIGGLL